MHSFTGRQTADLCSWSTGNANELQFAVAGGFRVYLSRYIQSETFPYAFNAQELTASTQDLCHINIITNLHRILSQVIRANNWINPELLHTGKNIIAKRPSSSYSLPVNDYMMKEEVQKESYCFTSKCWKKYLQTLASNSKAPFYSQQQQCLRLLHHTLQQNQLKFLLSVTSTITSTQTGRKHKYCQVDSTWTQRLRITQRQFQ